MEAQRRRKCLLCGRPTMQLVCLFCAARLRREALRIEIEDEKKGKKPHHFQHS